MIYAQLFLRVIDTSPALTGSYAIRIDNARG